MTHSEMLKLATWDQTISKPFLSRPGFKAVMDSRQKMTVNPQARPSVQDIIQNHQGYWDTEKKEAGVFTTADDPLLTKRHEILHGIQDVGKPENLNPMQRFGGAAIRQESPAVNNTFLGGLKHLAAELDARIGSTKSIPAGAASMIWDAPVYAKKMMGAAKIPFNILSLLSRLV